MRSALFTLSAAFATGRRALLPHQARSRIVMKSMVVGNVMRSRKVLAFGVVMVAALVAVMVIVVAASPAEAAFPGSNGKIVFWATRSIVADPLTTDTEIFSMNPNGTGLTQLTVNDTQDFNPAWSPDGTQIVFESRRDGNDEIYKMGEAGSNQTRLTN